jgi:hypothetical protein
VDPADDPPGEAEPQEDAAQAIPPAIAMRRSIRTAQTIDSPGRGETDGGIPKRNVFLFSVVIRISGGNYTLPRLRAECIDDYEAMAGEFMLGLPCEWMEKTGTRREIGVVLRVFALNTVRADRFPFHCI